MSKRVEIKARKVLVKAVRPKGKPTPEQIDAVRGWSAR